MALVGGFIRGVVLVTLLQYFCRPYYIKPWTPAAVRHLIIPDRLARYGAAGQSRIQLRLHAVNKEEQVELLATAILMHKTISLVLCSSPLHIFANLASEVIGNEKVADEARGKRSKAAEQVYGVDSCLCPTSGWLGAANMVSDIIILPILAVVP